MEQRLLVQETLAEVRRLRELNFNGSDDLVLELLHSYPSDQSATDLLWNDLPEDALVQDISDLLSLWSWRTDDNGAGIMRAVERWIDEGLNRKQIAVALSLDAYPFVDHVIRIRKLQRTALYFPELAQRCDEIIAQSQEWLARDASKAG